MSQGAAFAVNRTGVRRFLLEAQGLLPGAGIAPESPGQRATPDTVLQMLRRLECVQLDPVAAVERNQHLALAARMPGYKPELLEELLSQGRIFEYLANAACAIPIEDYPLFGPTRRLWRERLQGELEALGPVVAEVMARLEAEGPLPARAFTAARRVSGYWDSAPKTKATSHALNVLADAGEIMVVRREKGERFFDLPQRAVPADFLRRSEEMEPEAAWAALLEKYLRAYRVFDLGDFRFGWRRMAAAERRAVVAGLVQAGQVVPLQIEGVRRQYYVLAADLDRLRAWAREAPAEEPLPVEGPVRFLPPLDNLLWRRERLLDLFGFAYTWEVYYPPAKRRYGYYAMPILAGDRLIGRMDPRLDRTRGRLVVRLLQIEPDLSLTSPLRRALQEGLEAFARFHGAGDWVVETTEPADLAL